MVRRRQLLKGASGMGMAMALGPGFWQRALAAPAAAQDAMSFEFNLGVASDYVFRGVSQTDEDPQVFGGADAKFGGAHVTRG